MCNDSECMFQRMYSQPTKEEVEEAQKRMGAINSESSHCGWSQLKGRP